jgi:hypothetical protein
VERALEGRTVEEVKAALKEGEFKENPPGWAVWRLEDEEWEPPEPEEEWEPLIKTVRVNEDKLGEDTKEVLRENGTDGLEEAVKAGWRYAKSRSMNQFEGWVYKLPDVGWVPSWVFWMETEEGDHARKLLKEDGCEIRMKGG